MPKKTVTFGDVTVYFYDVDEKKTNVRKICSSNSRLSHVITQSNRRQITIHEGNNLNSTQSPYRQIIKRASNVKGKRRKAKKRRSTKRCFKFGVLGSILREISWPRRRENKLIYVRPVYGNIYKKKNNRYGSMKYKQKKAKKRRSTNKCFIFGVLGSILRKLSWPIRKENKLIYVRPVYGNIYKKKHNHYGSMKYKQKKAKKRRSTNRCFVFGILGSTVRKFIWPRRRENNLIYVRPVYGNIYKKKHNRYGSMKYKQKKAKAKKRGSPKKLNSFRVFLNRSSEIFRRGGNTPNDTRSVYRSQGKGVVNEITSSPIVPTYKKDEIERLPPPFLWIKDTSTTEDKQFIKDEEDVICSPQSEMPPVRKGFRKYVTGKLRRLLKKKTPPEYKIYTSPAKAHICLLAKCFNVPFHI